MVDRLGKLPVFASGRFVPAMAMITASVEPRNRGGFMSVNSTVQQVAAGLATTVAALLAGSDVHGRITGYPRGGWLSPTLIIASVFIIRRLRVAAAPAPVTAATAPEPVGETVG
jgi:MFS family permease